MAGFAGRTVTEELGVIDGHAVIFDRLGWSGVVSEIGGWGGGVMNGGAWLSIEGRRVDVHYRDLNDVEHWCNEAVAGRFRKELLLFYVAGIPTYVFIRGLTSRSG